MIRLKWSWLVSLLLVVTLAGCGGGEAPSVQEEAALEEAPAGPPAEPIDPETVGAITGSVAFAGETPRRVRIRMDAVPACTESNPDPVYSEEVLVNENGTLQNVFVYVKEGLENRTFDVPEQLVHLDQKGCVYHPHVLGLMTGQTLHIMNSDPTNHNIHPMPAQNREWNKSQPPDTAALREQFPRPEVMLPVKCNVHPWMKAYIGVLRHPFFAVTGTDGAFSLEGLPPGDYTIEAWHEKYGTAEQTVTIGEKETQEIEFTFSS